MNFAPLLLGLWLAAGNLSVEVRDQKNGEVIPARVYLTDSSGGFHAPAGAITYEKQKEHHFITPGRFEIDLPAGDYTLTVERGLEYRPQTLALRIGEAPAKVEVKLERWVSMNERGWYSADLHNHRKVDEMPQLLLAEDLNLAPTLTDWIWEGRPISSPPATKDPIRQVDATHVFSVLDKEIERLKQGPGAVDLLGLKSVIPFEGNWLYPPNNRFAELAHKQGGYVDAEKSSGATRLLWSHWATWTSPASCTITLTAMASNWKQTHGACRRNTAWSSTPLPECRFGRWTCTTGS